MQTTYQPVNLVTPNPIVNNLSQGFPADALTNPNQLFLFSLDPHFRPSDVEINSATRARGSGTLTFSAGGLSVSFPVGNTVVNGINKLPNNVTTNGEGSTTGEEVEITITFTSPIILTVARRTREIGIRVALGAGRRDLIWMVVRGVLAPVVAGLAVGVLAVVALAQLVRSLLYGVGPADPSTIAGTALLMCVVAAAAAYPPARRATKVDPMVALRFE